ncbi:hypothetical protein ACFL56_01835 [Candidatus Margulisiibacteriota bacterium]
MLQTKIIFTTTATIQSNSQFDHPFLSIILPPLLFLDNLIAAIRTSLFQKRFKLTRFHKLHTLFTDAKSYKITDSIVHLYVQNLSNFLLYQTSSFVNLKDRVLYSLLPIYQSLPKEIQNHMYAKFLFINVLVETFLKVAITEFYDYKDNNVPMDNPVLHTQLFNETVNLLDTNYTKNYTNQMLTTNYITALTLLFNSNENATLLSQLLQSLSTEEHDSLLHILQKQFLSNSKFMIYLVGEVSDMTLFETIWEDVHPNFKNNIIEIKPLIACIGRYNIISPNKKENYAIQNKKALILYKHFPEKLRCSSDLLQVFLKYIDWTIDTIDEFYRLLPSRAFMSPSVITVLADAFAKSIYLFCNPTQYSNVFYLPDAISRSVRLLRSIKNNALKGAIIGMILYYDNTLGFKLKSSL